MESYTTLWLNKWLLLTEQEKYEILTWPEDGINIKDVSAISENLLKIKTISDELLYELTNVKIKIPYWSTNIKTEYIFPMIKEIYQRELEHFNNNKIVFYHGQSSDHGLLNYVHKISNQRAKKSGLEYCDFYPYWNEKNFENVEMNYFAVDRAINMGMHLDDCFHQDVNINSRLFSINYSLFGNYGIEQVGESSIHYFIYNFSQIQSSQYVKYVPYINDQERKSIVSVLEELESKRMEHCGRIVSFIIPKDKVDQYVYNSLSLGRIAPIQYVSSFFPLSFKDIDNSQGRIVDFHIINNDLSIEIFEDENYMIPYKMKIDNILLNYNEN